MSEHDGIQTQKATAHSGTGRSIILLAFAAYTSAASIRICDTVLPQLAQTFGTTTGQAARVITAFIVAYGLFQLFYGPLGDRYNKYRLIAFASLACTLGNIGAAVSPDLGWLIFFRGMTGATAAAIIPLSMAWIGDMVPYEQRQATLARFLSGPLLGMISGQFLGGVFADTLGWRWGLVFVAGIYVVISALLHLELRRNPSLRAKPAHTFTAGALASFPAQVLAVLRLPWARVILVTAFLEGMTAFGTLAFVPSYLHARFGIALTLAGALTAAFGLGGVLYTVIAARIVNRFGERGLTLGAAPLLGAAFLGYFFGPEWYWALPSSFIGGLGFYMLHNTLQTNATQMAPKTRGTGVALYVATFFLSQSAGVAIAAVVVDSVGASWLFIPTALILPLVSIGFSYALRFRKA